MNFTTYTPTDQLKPFIKQYLVVESRVELMNRILPDTCVVLGFRFKGLVRDVLENYKEILPDTSISGLRKSVRLINYQKDAGTILVVFKEGGATAFFKQPLQDLFGSVISLDDFIPGQTIRYIREQIAEAENNLQRIAIIENFLLKRFNPNSDRLISAAVQNIYSSSGSIRINDLVKSLYISQDAFEKRFRKAIGTSPKQFSSIIRMKSAIKNFSREQRLTDIVFDAGYFDQPHFNKEFKIFTGLSPTEFFKSPSPW